MVLVDTNIVSFVVRGDPVADLYRRHLDGRRLVVSSMTIAEIEKGMLRSQWGTARRSSMFDHLRGYLVHPYDRALCKMWASVKCEGDSAGHPIGDPDAWIAATARLHDLPLVTHDRHFLRVDSLRVLCEATPT